MKNNNYLVDGRGWNYYDKLPVDFHLAKLDDFQYRGRMKIGLSFLIKWADKEYYQICIVSENFTSRFIFPFIKANRVFIKK